MKLVVILDKHPQNVELIIAREMRFFHSKAAALVLVWSLCFAISLWSSGAMTGPVYSGLKIIMDDNFLFGIVGTIPLVVLVISIPCSGWFADAKFGNFKVFKNGSVILFVGSVLVSVCTLAVTSQPKFSRTSLIISASLGPLSNFVGFAGGGACLVTVFQLGLDQMPDASSLNITSYTAWFGISLFFGFWVSNSVYTIAMHCTDSVEGIQLASLLPVLCTSVVLASLYVLGKKWLIIEPQSLGTLKIFFKILKFASKHRSPIYRSAFTYWEEKIPSRIDLAKSRYGGPFTLEQVEDVKTILRLLVTFIPLWITLFGVNVYGSFYMLTNTLDIPELLNYSSCVNHVVSKFTYDPWWWSFLATFLCEILIFPCLGNRFSMSIIKRLGLIQFFLTLISVAYSVIDFIHPNEEISVWAFIAFTALSNAAFGFVIVNVMEFVCAQSPYNMRGLISGFASFTIFMFAFLGYSLSLAFTHVCSAKYCDTIQSSIGVFLTAVGFLLHFVMACCYKYRVREEGYNLHYQVEQTYEKYVSYNN